MKISILLSSLLLLSFSFHAQDLKESYFSVEWISDFSHEKDIKTEDGIFSNLIDIVLGETEKKLIKPFNLVRIDQNSYLILDQGLMTPLLVSSDGFETIENNQYQIFPSLVGVCRFKEDKILFTDSKLSKIFIYDINEDELNTFPTSTKISKPTGIAYDDIHKNIYISETDKHRIIVLSENGQLIDTIGKRGEAEGEFNFPSFLTVDGNGSLYVVDALNFRIQIFNGKGEFIKSFGEAGDATGYFNRPKGIKVNSYGHIFLVDALFHSVQVFNTDGKFLYNFGGLGSLNSRFWLPIGIDIDDQNNIFVADSYNSRIQIFRLIDDKN
ncbi:MAG: hypothetical protein ABFS12_14805 [Bacteroidota bacterium]